MSIINKLLFNLLILFFLNTTIIQAEEIERVGKYKDWEVIVLKNENEKVCFAQSMPVLQSPKKNTREARLFISFRPNDKISDEISATSGYEYNKQNAIIARSGKSKFELNVVQENFAWIASNKIEKKNDQSNEKRNKNYDNWI